MGGLAPIPRPLKAELTHSGSHHQVTDPEHLRYKCQMFFVSDIEGLVALLTIFCTSDSIRLADHTHSCTRPTCIFLRHPEYLSCSLSNVAIFFASTALLTFRQQHSDDNVNGWAQDGHNKHRMGVGIVLQKQGKGQDRGGMQSKAPHCPRGTFRQWPRDPLFIFGYQFCLPRMYLFWV